MAAATLRQLGLWPEKPRSTIRPGEPPAYTEQDVLDTAKRDNYFQILCSEIEKLLNDRKLTVDEMKTVLGFIRYLGLPTEVIQLLVSYCVNRERQRALLRNPQSVDFRRPGFRAIEKEAYHWADAGIDTLEAAAAYDSKSG